MGLSKCDCIIINKGGIMIGGGKGDKGYETCQIGYMDFYVNCRNFVRNKRMGFLKPDSTHIRMNASGVLNKVKSNKDINEISWIDPIKCQYFIKPSHLGALHLNFLSQKFMVVLLDSSFFSE